MRWIALIVLALMLAACGGTHGPLDGAALYANNCARCHDGNPNLGLGPGSAAAAKTDVLYREVIRQGPGAMPSFRGFSDAELDLIIGYLRQQQGLDDAG